MGRPWRQVYRDSLVPRIEYLCGFSGCSSRCDRGRRLATPPSQSFNITKEQWRLWASGLGWSRPKSRRELPPPPAAAAAAPPGVSPRGRELHARVRALPQRVNRGKGCPTPARFAYDRLGPLPPVARGHGGKPTPHAVATFASSIKSSGGGARRRAAAPPPPQRSGVETAEPVATRHRPRVA